MFLCICDFGCEINSNIVTDFYELTQKQQHILFYNSTISMPIAYDSNKNIMSRLPRRLLKEYNAIVTLIALL
jgi:hypothetical protein